MLKAILSATVVVSLAHTAASAGDSLRIIPFRETSGAIIIDANINGTVCPMLFDTGATMCLSPAMWDSLHLNETSTSQSFTDSRGSHVNSYTAPMPSFTLGGTVYSNLSAMRLDIPSIPGFSCYGISGVAGPEIIGGKVCTIDFQAHTLTLADSLDTPLAPGSVSVPMTRRYNDQPWLWLSVGGDSLLCSFDTGSNSTLKLSRQATESLLDTCAYRYTEYGYTATGGGGYGSADTLVSIKTAGAVSAASMPLGDVPAIVHSKPTNIMGTRLMRHYRITLNYPASTIIFTPVVADGSEPECPFAATLGYSSGNIIIASVRTAPGCSQPPVSTGTKVTAVNGHRLPSTASPAILCDVLSSVSQSRAMRLRVIDDNGRERKVKIHRLRIK